MQTIVEFKGENNLITPFKIPASQAVSFINIDTQSQTLKSSTNHYDSPFLTSGPYYYPSINYYSNIPLNLEYLNGYTYTTTRGYSQTSILQRHDPDTTIHSVGLATPSNSINLSESGDYYREEGFQYGFFYYAITFYNEDTGEESEPVISDVFGAEKVIINVAIDVSDITSTNATHINIYRIGNFIDKFSLVESIPASSISDKVNYSYADSKADTALTKLLVTKGTMQPPVGLCNLVYHNGRFFGSVGSRLHFSPFSNATRWESFSYIDFDSNIVALASINYILVVFLRDKVYSISGNDISNFQKRPLTSDIGCTSAMSVAALKNTIIWHSDNGLIGSDGSAVQYLTRDFYVFPDNMSIKIKDSGVIEDKYYLLTDDYLYSLDLYNGIAIQRYLVPDTYNSLSINNHILTAIDTYLIHLFKGTGLAEFTYRSKVFTGPLYNFNLELKRFSITCTGTFTLTFYKEDSEQFAQHSFVTNGTEIVDFYFDSENDEVQSFQVEIKGVGEVFAYTLDEYSPEAENVISKS